MVSNVKCSRGKDIKKLLILGAGPEQVIAYNIAKELGLYTIGIDDNPEAAAKLYADEFHSTIIKDHAGLIARAKKIKPDGVMTHAAELSIEVAKIAEHLRLPGISIESAINSTLKDKRLGVFRNSNVNIPEYFVLSSETDTTYFFEVADLLGFPFVMKPNNSKGAFNVMKIKNHQELLEYKNSIIQQHPGTYIAEALISGNQYSTESIFFHGDMIWNAIALRHYEGMERFLPYLIEDGHSMPVQINPEIKNAIESEIIKARKALNINSGVLKGDIVVNQDGKVIVLEMASRTSGGRYADFVTPLSCGVNILYPLIQMAVGEPPSIELLQPAYIRGASQRFIFLKEGSRALKKPDIARYKELDNIQEIVFSDDFLEHSKQGKIRCHRDRIGYVICTGETREAADASARQAVEFIRKDLVSS